MKKKNKEHFYKWSKWNEHHFLDTDNARVSIYPANQPTWYAWDISVNFNDWRLSHFKCRIKGLKGAKVEAITCLQKVIEKKILSLEKEHQKLERFGKYRPDYISKDS